MIFTMTIDSRNAVFSGGGRAEVARILRDVAEGVEAGGEGCTLFESNGKSRAELIEGLESICVACYDEESDELLADAYGDSMLAGDLPGDSSNWRGELLNCWEGWQ